MKRMTGITLAGLSALAASADTLDVPRLTAPAFADREVAGDAALPAGRPADLRTLTAAFRVSAQGTPQTPSFEDGGSPFAFPGLALTPFPEWMKPHGWTDLRVTARGYTGTNETVRAKFLPDGARIVIR